MSPLRLAARIAVISLVLSAPHRAMAETKAWPAEYYEAHYLVTVADDAVGAKALFEKVYGDAALSATQRDEVRGRINDCQERQASRNLAQLCPAGTMAYVEVHQPGALLERVTAMMGIPTQPILPTLARQSAESNTGVSAVGFKPHVPEQIAISPALMAWVKSFKGVAVALTGLETRGHGGMDATGLLILDLGDTELARGLLETAAQFGPPAAPIDGHPAFTLPEGGCAVMTGRMVIAGKPRANVEAAVARIKGDAKESLAGSERFASLLKGKAGSTVFAYVDAQKVLAAVRPAMENDDEFQMVRALCDLDHLSGAAIGIGAIDGGLGLDASILMEEGHHNLIYNLLRTPAMSRKSLACVPGNAAYVLGFGLNPPHGDEAAGTNAKGKMMKRVTGLDVFREIFGNIEEISLYVAPSEGALFGGGKKSTPAYIPNGAIVVAAGDAEKSEALWKQLLTLPSILMHKEVAPPSEVEVSGEKATVFAMPNVGNIYLARAGGCLVVTPRKESLSAVIRTVKNGRSVLKDAAMRPAFDKLGKDVGLLWVMHGGRLMRTMGTLAPAMMGDDGPPPAMMNVLTGTVTPALESMLVYAGVVESDTELGVRVCVAGLPNVNMLLKQFGPMVKMFQGMHGGSRDGETATHGERKPRRVVKAIPREAPSEE